MNEKYDPPKRLAFSGWAKQILTMISAFLAKAGMLQLTNGFSDQSKSEKPCPSNDSAASLTNVGNARYLNINFELGADVIKRDPTLLDKSFTMMIELPAEMDLTENRIMRITDLYVGSPLFKVVGYVILDRQAVLHLEGYNES